MSSHLSQQKTVQDVKTFEIVQTTPSKVTNVIIMVLFVQSQQTHVLDLSQQKTVQDVKTFVNDHEGQPLEDACQLYNFKNEATLHVELRIVGGKVHGSLARAGKVRGQTPKVEAQEKKKSKTGRAKRRMQYNRRFVNVVAGFGRKKGPNARS